MARWRKDKTDAGGVAVRKAARELMDYAKSVKDVFYFEQRIYRAQEWLKEVKGTNGTD